MIIGFGSYLKDYLTYNNISQTEFAKRMGITTKHLNEILNKNIDISNDLLVTISQLTDIDIDFILKIEHAKRQKQYLTTKFKTETALKEYLKQFQPNELEKKKWLIFHDKTNPYQKAMDILNYIKFRNFDNLESYEDNILYKKKEDSDIVKIMLWIAHCDELAKDQVVSDYNKKSLPALLNQLKGIREKPVNLTDLTKQFNQFGFYFLVEEALKSSKIRGCFKVKGNKPTIYLTTLYKDKASFYFALYHELGHCKSDYNKAKSKVLIDAEEDLEKKADQFALDQMIPPQLWQTIKENPNEDTLIKIQKEEHIPICFMTSRLAFEKKISYHDDLFKKYKEPI